MPQSASKSPTVVAPGTDGSTPAPSNSSKNGGKGKQALGQAKGVGGAVVGILSSLSAIPFLGQPLRPLVSSIRQTQSRASQVSRMPSQAMRPVTQLAKQVPISGDKFKASGASPTAQPPAPNRASTQPKLASDQTEFAPGPEQSNVEQPDQIKQPFVPEQSPKVSDWSPSPSFETSLVEPDQSLAVELRLRPAAVPHKTRCYQFRLTAKQIDLVDGADLPDEKTTEESIKLAGISRWYQPLRFWTFMLFIMVMVNLFWIFLLLSTLDIFEYIIPTLRGVIG